MLYFFFFVFVFMDFCNFFFFNDTATTEIYTLSLHDALPIWSVAWLRASARDGSGERAASDRAGSFPDRKSTRLNSSRDQISYAVFCLKKKKKKKENLKKRKTNNKHPKKEKKSQNN